jgi:hypothetical protein
MRYRIAFAGCDDLLPLLLLFSFFVEDGMLYLTIETAGMMWSSSKRLNT